MHAFINNYAFYDPQTSAHVQLSPSIASHRSAACPSLPSEHAQSHSHPQTMTSPRHTFSRDSILRFRHSESIPALPRSVRRTLWWLKLLKLNQGKSELSELFAHTDDPCTFCSGATRSSTEESNTPDLSGSAEDREALKDRAPAATNRPFRFATFNCRTLKAPWRRGLLVQLAMDLKIDMMMLQEHSIVSDPGLQNEDLGGGWTFRYSRQAKSRRRWCSSQPSSEPKRLLCDTVSSAVTR